MILVLLGICGILIALYAICVERLAPGVTAMCDINNRASCSRVLKSPYGRMMKLCFDLPDNHPLNVPNTYYGILYYSGIILYNFVTVPYQETLLFIASIFSMFVSLQLALILYYKLKDFCIVCVTTYVINFFIFYHAWNLMIAYIMLSSKKMINYVPGITIIII
uniref:vitamin-K-epoxide reductase (warfarin-sensitive) n=1 Tax=viral metagenome TaxID=1070528 RepID=A0A6C0C7D6_9ZZZZ